MARNYYEALGLPRWTTRDTIEATYRKEMELMQAVRAQAERLSPVEAERARTTSEEHWKEITEAYEVLSNPRKRKQYDKFLKRFQAPSPLERRLSSEARHFRLSITRWLLLLVGCAFFIDSLFHTYTWPGEVFQPTRLDRLIRVLWTHSREGFDTWVMLLCALLIVFSSQRESTSR
jgi:hypothetical protein